MGISALLVTWWATQYNVLPVKQVGSLYYLLNLFREEDCLLYDLLTVFTINIHLYVFLTNSISNTKYKIFAYNLLVTLNFL